MDAQARHAAHEAAPLLAHALSYESSLRVRTEGLTWSIWGIVLALVMLMYGAMGGMGDEAPLWTQALWVPWVVAGGLLTWALWRTAALSIQDARRAPAGLVVTLAWMGAIAGGLAVFGLAQRFSDPESVVLVAIGVAWLVAGATNLFRATPEGRRTVVAIGATLLAIGLALSMLLPPPAWHSADADRVRFARDVVRAGIAAGVPLAGGLWQALRG